MKGRIRFVDTPEGRMTFRQLAVKTGITVGGVSSRLHNGWTGADLLLPRQYGWTRSARKVIHTDDPLNSLVSGASITLYIALRLVSRFGKKTPTKEQLMNEFGVCRATAYRWISAWKQAFAQ